jgi:hypothetical protein
MTGIEPLFAAAADAHIFDVGHAFRRADTSLLERPDDHGS